MHGKSVKGGKRTRSREGAFANTDQSHELEVVFMAAREHWPARIALAVEGQRVVCIGTDIRVRRLACVGPFWAGSIRIFAAKVTDLAHILVVEIIPFLAALHFHG